MCVRVCVQVLVKDWRRIGKRYIRHGLLLDLVSSMPFSLFISGTASFSLLAKEATVTKEPCPCNTLP